MCEVVKIDMVVCVSLDSFLCWLCFCLCLCLGYSIFRFLGLRTCNGWGVDLGS